MSWRMWARAWKPEVLFTAPPLGAGSEVEELGASGSSNGPPPPLTLTGDWDRRGP